MLRPGRKLQVVDLPREHRFDEETANCPCDFIERCRSHFMQTAHAHLQHRSRCEHMRQRQSSGSSKARGSSSPDRVASMMLSARSDHSCARSALNGTAKCSHSHVSAFSTVNSAGAITSRYA